MRKSPLRTGMLAVAVAMSWVAASLSAQMSGGQARAAQSVAAQGTARQTSAPPAAASSSQAATPSSSPAQTAPAPPASSGGRRDPFRPLVVRGVVDQPPVCASSGKGALLIGQVTVQGIVRGLNGQWIAVADNKTNRAYFLYVGDALCNGTVSRITESSVVFEERLSDQAGRPRTREVVKQLNPN